MDNKTIRIIKLIPGTLVLRFQNAINYENERDFIIPAGQEYINLPIELVVSMFQLPGTMALYNKGYFSFGEKDKEAVFTYARTLSLYYEDGGSDNNQEQVIYTEKQVREILQMKRLNDIDKIIEKGTRPQQLMLVEVTRQMLDTLPMSIVKKIENGLGVQLNEGDE